MLFTCQEQEKKNHFLAFLIWFLLFGKIQDGGLVGNHVWWRYRPPATPPPIKYTLNWREDQWKQNRFEILQHIKNSRDRGSINPSPLEPRWWYDFSCTSEGIKSDQRVWETSRWKSVSKAWAYAAKSHSTSTQYRQLRRLIITPTQEYTGAKTVMHDIPCTFRKFFEYPNLA